MHYDSRTRTPLSPERSILARSRVKYHRIEMHSAAKTYSAAKIVHRETLLTRELALLHRCLASLESQVTRVTAIRLMILSKMKIEIARGKFSRLGGVPKTFA